MKRFCLSFFLSTFLVLQGFPQLFLQEDFEEKIEKISERLESELDRLAASVEMLADEFDDKEFPWRVHLNTAQHKASLGVKVNELLAEKARRLGFSNVYGSLVQKVYPQSPAEKAGIKPFDYLIGINGEYVDEERSFSVLLENYEPNEKVTIHLIRKGEALDVEVVLEESGRIGYVLNDLRFVWLGVSPAVQERADDYDGVSVRVSPNSPAQRMGLQDGDVIKTINQMPILEWDDLRTALDNLSPEDEVIVEFARNGEMQTTKGKLGSRFGIIIHPEVPEVLIEPRHFEGALDVPFATENFEKPETEDDPDWQVAESPFIGVYVEKMTQQKAAKLGIDNPYGIYVSGIVPCSAAEKAGLMPLDYIYGIDEYRVGEAQTLSDILKRYKPGDTAELHFFRKGEKKTVRITFGKYMDYPQKPEPANDCEDPFLGVLQQYGKEQEEGIPISVVKGSTAEELGLQKDDVLIAINGHKMVDWDDVKIAINMIKPGEKIEVAYLRNGERRIGSATMKSLAETKNCKNCVCEENADVVVKLNKVPNVRFNDTYKSVPESGAGRKLSIENLTLSVVNADGELDRLQAAGLVSMEVSVGLNLTDFQVKADAGSGLFQVGFDLPTPGNYEIKVVDETNKVIYEAELVDYGGRYEDTLDLAQKAPGVFFLVVMHNGKAALKKISLQ